MVPSPDTHRQAYLILELTYESLVFLQQQQQTQYLQKTSSTQRQRISSNTLLLPSSRALYDAILILMAKGILQGVQGFLDRAFTSLRYQVELLIKHSTIDVRPQLDIMDRITSACYRVSTDDWASLHTSGLESIIFERTLIDLLHPIWANLHLRSQRDNSWDHLDLSDRIHVLLQVEELVASILVRLHTLLSQNLASRLSPHLLSLVMMALRIYDECLLPIHLSHWCHSDISLLLVGVLALLEICEHGAVDRALQAMHSSASPQNLASCKAFIVTLTEYSGIFHSGGLTDASVLPGDLVPSADVLPQISYANPLFHLMEQGDERECPSLARKEQQRWTIAFFYLKLLHNKPSDAPEDLGQAVIEFLNREEDFDDFYGASWIQLTWIYVRIIQASAPESMTKRSLARFKLFHGLKISIQDSRGWFAKSLLLAHLDDILVLAWDGAYTDGVSICDFHEGLFLKLTVFIDICREMELKANKIDYGRCLQIFHTVCNVMRTVARIAVEQPIYTTRAGQEFFNCVVIATFQSLAKEALPTDEARRQWRQHQMGSSKHSMPLQVPCSMLLNSFAQNLHTNMGIYVCTA
ncbi:hypothetical protein BGZ68_007943 [Mortierella alpina]|nr:hypothetical protein BGZ68_007943 [Mortierella alpina]